MRLATLATGLCYLALLSAPALAQTAGQSPAPFDMSPESDLVTPQAPLPVPQLPRPPTALPSAGMPTLPSGTPAAAPATPVTPPEAPQPEMFERPIIPFNVLRLAGENAQRGIDLYLTTEQASAPASLHVGFTNAVVNAPETSQLVTFINGVEVASTPINSSTDISVLEANVPENVLRAGSNLLEFRAVQRHRTDCSIESTYELWTEIDPSQTNLTFAETGLRRITSVADLGAIGFDAQGETTLRFFVPGIDRPEAKNAALSLVQEVALATRVAHPTIVLTDDPNAATPSGTLNVVMARASELPEQFAGLAGQAAAGPMTTLLPAEQANNTLVVSGPDWQSIASAIRSIHSPASLDTNFLPTRADYPYQMPRVTGASSFTLAELGANTVEFNGRRLRTQFAFALPADFYASMYGQVQVRLDAAYTGEVLPGSQIDIYVNGQIASATPVLRTNGGTFRDTVIKVPMTHFRPGRNIMEIEVVLQTARDQVCPPGLTENAPVRFLLSSSTRLEFPDFARILALPDLATLTSTGAPYANSEATPVAVDGNEESFIAALTWLARLAISADGEVPVRLVTQEELDPAQNALVISPLSTLSDRVFQRSGVARFDPGGGSVDGDAALDRWSEAIDQNSDPLLAIQTWVADRIGLTPDNLRLIRRGDGAFLPQAPDAAILSQTRQAEGGWWTFLTIPEAQGFTAAVQNLTRTGNWRAIDGRVSAINATDTNVLAIAPNDVILEPTQPLSFWNLRLVAANWLSTNVLNFAALLGAMALVLTLATAALLRIVGRKE